MEGGKIIEEVFDSLSVEFLIAQMGKGEFAFEKEDVKVIIPFQKLSRLPRMPEEVLGMIFYEGLILPVIDAGKILDKGETEEATKIMVVAAEGMRAGLLVKSVPRMVEVQLKDVMKVEGEDFISSYLAVGSEKIPCVSVKAILNFVRGRMK